MNKLAIGLIMLASLLGTMFLQGVQLHRLTQAQANSDTSPTALQQQLDTTSLQLSVLRTVPSLGFRNIVANWTFLRFLQYFGNQDARQVTGYSLSPNFFDVIIKQDPRFVQSYLFLSTSTSIFAGLPERSVALMDQGLQVMTPQTPPQSYLVWRYKGIDELLFLGDGQAAQQSFEHAAEWASQDPTPEAQAVAQTSRQSAQFLARNSQSRAAQISSWVSILINAVDEQTQKIAIQRIQALGGTILVNEQGQVTVQYKADD